MLPGEEHSVVVRSEWGNERKKEKGRSKPVAYNVPTDCKCA